MCRGQISQKEPLLDLPVALSVYLCPIVPFIISSFVRSSVCQSDRQSVSLSVCLSVCLFVCLSVYLSVCQPSVFWRNHLFLTIC